MIIHSSSASPSEPRGDYDLFISYSRRNQEFVRRLHQALAQARQNVWIDWEDIPPTAEWRQEIYQGIEAAHNFVFVISPDSVESAVAQEELAHAIQCCKRLVPIVWQEANSKAVHPELAKLNWIFFREQDQFDIALQKLIEAIETDLVYVKVHTRLLVRAREWENKSYDPSFLLRGSDLEDAEQWLTQNMGKTPKPATLQSEYIRTSRQVETERQAVELRLHRITPQQYRNRQALLNKVNNHWVKGVLEHALQGRPPICLSLQARPDAVTHAWNINLGGAAPRPNSLSLPPGTQAIHIFDQLGEGRTLLILGEPGAGKTITLLELARELVARAEQSIDHRIPVVLNLSSWQGEKQTMAEWLLTELNMEYQVPKAIGKTWIQEQQLLLLLDGLDEVQTVNREAGIAAINNFHQEYGSEIVVCSRLREYEALSNRFNFQSAIYLRSLTPEQIDRYLNSDRANLAAVQALVEADQALQELAKSPLMLNIMVMAYQGVTFSELPCTTLEEHRQHLFESYVERMLSYQGAQAIDAKQQTMHWLNYLAQSLMRASQTVFLIERLQPSWLLSAHQKWAYRLGVRLSLGLILGLICGFIFIVSGNEWPWSLLFGTISGLIFGFISSLPARAAAFIAEGIFGLIITLFMLSNGMNKITELTIFGVIFLVVFHCILVQKIESVDALHWSWTQARNRLMGGLLLGFALGPIMPGFAPQRPFNVWGWLLLALYVGLITGIGLGFKKVSEVERTTIPNQGIWKSRNNALIISALSGLILGVVSWLFWWASYFNEDLIWWIYYGKLENSPIFYGLLFGISLGFINGLIAGLVGGGGSGLVCIQHFILRIVLWWNRYIPWNYARFLDYATESVLLQKVGGGYIFIHRLLLEHFAQMKPSK
ncbi:MAG: TIR domain-containing protein [Cyanothece sp. SIO1E1]|nr:TIR domain-containing protein [Cyanothece sp. SIO1E1]